MVKNPKHECSGLGPKGKQQCESCIAQRVKCTLATPATVEMTADEATAAGYVLADKDDEAHVGKYKGAKANKEAKTPEPLKTPLLPA